MMNKELEKMIAELTACEDGWISDREDGEYAITFDDFGGFDEHWCEMDREYVKPELVDSIIDWLDKNALSIEDDYYMVYHFDGYSVQVGYTSYDI
jgi:hypothetical protein